VEELTPRELQALLKTKKPFFLFDVRSQDQFERWRIERKGGLECLNIPYFELIEKGGKADFKDSIREALQKELSKFPKNQQIVVVCAKGNTSNIVAELLRNLGLKALNLSGGMRSWGSFYDQKWLIQSDRLSILQCIRVARGCLSYVVASKDSAIIIDPFRNIAFYKDLFSSWPVKLRIIFDTHAHADHISGARELASFYQVPYLLHPYDGIHPIDMLPAAFSYEPSWGEKTYSLGDVSLQAIHIPGHTLGSLAFLLDKRYLFSGDSIFIHSLARPDLGGRAEAWTPLFHHSLQSLIHLPDDLLVLPAHFGGLEESNDNYTYGKTLRELKKTNEELQLIQKPPQAFNQYIAEHLPTFPPEYVDIKRINLGLLKPSEEKAEELELGKNMCAIKKMSSGSH